MTMPINLRRKDRVALTRKVVICALVAIVLQGFGPYAASTSAMAATTPAENARVLLAIEGMHCVSCASGIKAMLKRTPGVVSAEVSYERCEAEVEYDPSRTSTEKIIEAITNLGYKASVKENSGG